jgi:APA family basic amino acid/polyamine antiporter
LGFLFFDINNFPAFNLTDQSDLITIPVVGTLTLYAFLGIECATVPAENVKDPEITIPKATMLGTIIVTIVYILSTVILFGILPIEILKNSPAPFAEASKIIGGEYAGYFVAAGAAISAMGALNGWILISGQIPMATAKDDLFPKIFKKENKKGAPSLGIIIGSLLTSFVMLMNYSEGLVDQFEFIVLLSVLTALVPYFFTAAAYVLVIIDKKLHANNMIKTIVLATLGLSYSLWAIYGSGHDTVFYGLLLLLLGVPFYILMKWNKRK